MFQSESASLPANFAAAAAYDPGHNTTVDFGGVVAGAFSNETGILSSVNSSTAGTWSAGVISGSPTAREAPVMAYDPALGKMLMFGGAASAVDADTWTFNGTAWSQLTPAASPPARWLANMAWDPTDNVMLMYGGFPTTAGTNPLGDIWAFNGTNWTKYTPASSPAGRGGAQFAYDPIRNLAVLNGGCSTSSNCTPMSDTELFSVSSDQWTTPSVTTVPPARAFGTAVWDGDSSTVDMVAGAVGTSLVSDTWRWDGTNWAQAVGIASPGGRELAAAAYNTTDHADELIGGYGVTSGTAGNQTVSTSAALTDTWIASHLVPTVTSSITSTIVAGSPVTAAVVVGNPGSESHQVTGTTVTIPTGISPTGLSATATPLGGTATPCTTTTTPSCTFTGRRLAVGSVNLPGGASETFTISGLAEAVPSTESTGCPTTGGYVSQRPGGSFYTDQILTDNPAAFYRLNDSSGTIAMDYSPQHVNATYAGSPSLGQLAALVGDPASSVTLHSGSDQVNLPAGYGNLSAGFTYEGWVDPSTITTYGRLFDLSNGSNSNEVMLSRVGTTNALTLATLGSSGTAGISAPNALIPNTWQYIAATIDGSGNAAIYRNGALISQGKIPAPDVVSSRADNYLGHSPFSSPDQNWSGGFADVALYNSVLSASQLQAHYQDGYATGTGSLTATTSYQVSGTDRDVLASDDSIVYPLNEASGTTAYEAAYYNPQDGKNDAYSTLSGTYTGRATPGAAGAFPYQPDTSTSFAGNDGAGNDGYVALPAGFKFLSAGFSAEAWSKSGTANQGTYAPIFQISNGTNVDDVSFYRGSTGTDLYFGIFNTGSSYDTLEATNVIKPGTWQHLAVTLTAAKVATIYVNGVSVASKTMSIMPDANSRSQNYLGKTTYASNGFFVGNLQAVGISPYALTATQISAHYQAGLSQPGQGAQTAISGPALDCNTGSGLGLENYWTYTGQSTGDQAQAQVNVANGNLVLSQTDSLPVATRGHLALQLRRFYNSESTDPGTGYLGQGWQLDIGQADDLVGEGTTSPLGLLNTLNAAGTGPAGIDLADPAAVTLVDRDGTHHTFTPKISSIGGVTTSTAGPLVNSVLTSLANGKGICVDEPFTSPPGVHVSLFRYIDISGSSCNAAALASGSLLGFATVRPDRLRSTYSASGQLLDVADQAGVELKYVYDAKPTTLGSLGRLRFIYDATCPGVTTTDGSAGTTTVPSRCRALRLSYHDDPSASSSAPQGTPAGTAPSNDAGCTIPTATVSGVTAPTSALCVTDAAGLQTVYGSYAPVNTNTHTISGTKHLTVVVDPDGYQTDYAYGSDNSALCPASGAAPDQLCASVDRRKNTTAIGYTASTDPTNGLGAAGENLPVVTGITDRRRTKTQISYNGGAYTTVDTPTTPAATSCPATALCHRVLYRAIDSTGRVGEIDAGTTPGQVTAPVAPIYCAPTNNAGQPIIICALTQRFQTWDTPARTCVSPGNIVDNELCETVGREDNQYLNPNAAKDRDTSYTYGADGEILTQHVVLAGAGANNGLDTTNSYRLQRVNTDGTVTCIDYALMGSGIVTPTPATINTQGCGTAPTNIVSYLAGSASLYDLVDRTGTLGPRGNDPTYNDSNTPPTYTKFETTYHVDDNAKVQPNTGSGSGSSTACSSGGPTLNTGLVCEVDTPASQGVSTPAGVCQTSGQIACTRYAYDSYGEKTLSVSPLANTSSPAGPGTNYVYYGDNDNDLSGMTDAGGWLKAVVDPLATLTGNASSATGHFVEFGYDRAGHQIRSYDRKATTDAGVALNQYNDTYASPVTYTPTGASQPVPVPYTQTLYGPYSSAPNGSTAASAPWRYKLSTSTPLGETTTVTVDANGNAVTVKSPLGNSTMSVYDADGNLTTETPPTGSSDGTVTGTASATTFVYDGVNELTYEYKPVLVTGNAPPTTGWVYDTAGRVALTEVSRGVVSTVPSGCYTGVPGFTSNQVVCDTYYTIDGLGQTTEAMDPTGDYRYTYDSAGRKITATDIRSYSAQLVTQTNYDLDGNPVDVCPPRQSAEGGAGTCTSTGQYATHTAYDPAGHPVLVTRYRGATKLITSTHFDADGNPVSVSDPDSTTPGSGTNTTTANCPTLNYDSTAAAPATAFTRSVTYPATTGTPSSPADTADESPTHTTVTCYDLLDRKISQIAPSGSRDSGATTETTTWTYDAAGDTTGVVAPVGDLPTSSGAGTQDAETRDTAYSYDADHRVLDTITAASSPNAAADGNATTESPASPTSAGPANQRTRKVYDADGNVTTVYPPRSFIGYSSTAPVYEPDNGTTGINTVTTPDPRYATVTTYDTDDRPTAQYQGRYDTNGTGNQTDNLNNGNGDPRQDSQCPTSSASRSLIPTTVYTFFNANGANVGVCSTLTGYDADGNVVKTTLPTANDDGTQGDANTCYPCAPANRFITYSWTDDAHLASETTPDPRTDGQRITAASYTYDGDGRQLTQTDTPGLSTARTTTTTYTADGLVAEVVAPPGPGGSTSVGCSGTSAPNGSHATCTTYDANGDVLDVTQGAGTTQAQRTSTAYTSDGLIATQIAGELQADQMYSLGLDLVTSYGYDNNGNITSVTSPSGNAGEHGDGNKTPTTMTSYTPDNLVATETRVLTYSNNNPQTTRTVAFTYDDAGRKVTAATTEANPPTGVNPDGGSQTFDYYADDQLATQKGRAANLSENGTAYTYGTDLSGGVISTQYDPDGNTTDTADTTYSTSNDTGDATATAAQKTTASTDISSRYYFDDLLRNTISGGGQSSSYGYDGTGSMTERDSYSGISRTTFTYGDDGQPETEYDNGMDPTGTPVPGRTGTWKWTSYDALARPLTESIPSQAVPTNGTTPANTTQTMQQTMAWNSDDTLAQQTLADLKDTSTVSNGVNNGATAVNNRHAQWTYAYDSLSRITSQTLAEDGTAGQVVVNGAANNGALDTGTYTFGYDTDSRENSLTDITPGTNTARTRTMTYDEDGNRLGYGGSGVGTNSTLAQGATGSPTPCAASVTVSCANYSSDDGLAKTTDTGGTTHPVTVDSDGRQVDDGCQQISYDGFDRQHTTGPSPALTEALQSRNPDGTNTYALSCGTEGSGTATTNDPVSGGTYVVTTTADTNSTSVYGYDALDRQRYRDAASSTTTASTIKTTPGPGGVSPAPLPAPAGNTATNGTSALYNQDGSTQNVINQIETSGTTGPTTTGQTAPPSASTTAQVSYVLDSGSTPLAEFGTSQTTTGTNPPAAAVQTDGYLTTDGNGDITDVTSHSAVTECATRFDPYGTPERPSYKNSAKTDPDQAQDLCTTGTSTNEDWYQAARRDSVTGTYQFGTRTYDPSKGAFTTQDDYRTGEPADANTLTSDPLTGDTYNYVNGDPLNSSDPTGHCATPDCPGHLGSPGSYGLATGIPGKTFVFGGGTPAQTGAPAGALHSTAPSAALQKRYVETTTVNAAIDLEVAPRVEQPLQHIFTYTNLVVSSEVTGPSLDQLERLYEEGVINLATLQYFARQAFVQDNANRAAATIAAQTAQGQKISGGYGGGLCLGSSVGLGPFAFAPSVCLIGTTDGRLSIDTTGLLGGGQGNTSAKDLLSPKNIVKTLKGSLSVTDVFTDSGDACAQGGPFSAASGTYGDAAGGVAYGSGTTDIYAGVGLGASKSASAGTSGTYVYVLTGGPQCPHHG